MELRDLINGSFELIGAVVNWLNVYRLWQHKEVRGIDWRTYIFFAGWGWWNVYYYPSLGQWASAVAGLFLVLANTAWVVLALRYRSASNERVA